MAMKGRRRLERERGRYSLVDDIPFQMPVSSSDTPALMAAFPINADKAAELLPGNEVHPFRLWKRGLLMVTVVDYRQTVIGKYIEFSVAIACTHGRWRAPAFFPVLLQKPFGLGQFVVDLPVSSEISVKGGKGIWGMPKHQANLRFDIGEQTVSSQYDLDGQFCMMIEVAKCKPWLPLSTGAANYCTFRGMLMKSYIYFKGKIGMSLFKAGAAKLIIGDHPRVQYLKKLEISPDPVFTAWLPNTRGLLDDYFECWFISDPSAPDPSKPPEGMESVVNLGQSQAWLDQPFALVPGEGEIKTVDGIAKADKS
jgi:Acetoacetate decarboxylase (ADC)